MINIIDVNKQDRENPHITFEELLGQVGKKEEDIEEIYHGLDHWCRCGCGGNYFGHKDKGFRRAINAMKKDDFVTINVEKDPYGNQYLNIPEANKDNKCYCIYFKK